jgi:hypothetical protein
MIFLIFGPLSLFFNSSLADAGDELDDVSRVSCPVCRRSYKCRKHLLQHLRRNYHGCAQPSPGSLFGQRYSHLPHFRCSFLSCSYVTFVKRFLYEHAQEVHGVANIANVGADSMDSP